MIRYFIKEVDVNDVVHAQGQPKEKILQFNNTPPQQQKMEDFLRFKDLEGKGLDNRYITRELIGINFYPILLKENGIEK